MMWWRRFLQRRDERIAKMVQDNLKFELTLVTNLLEMSSRNDDKIIQAIVELTKIVSGLVDRVIKLENRDTKKKGVK